MKPFLRTQLERFARRLQELDVLGMLWDAVHLDVIAAQLLGGAPLGFRVDQLALESPSAGTDVVEPIPDLDDAEDAPVIVAKTDVDIGRVRRRAGRHRCRECAR